jgi:hypothetical protein
MTAFQVRLTPLVLRVAPYLDKNEQRSPIDEATALRPIQQILTLLYIGAPPLKQDRHNTRDGSIHYCKGRQRS